MPGGGGGDGQRDRLPTFDAESKSAKNQMSLCPRGGGGSVGRTSNF